MKTITKLKHSKKLPKPGPTQLQQSPLYPHELLKQLNTPQDQEIDKQDPLKLFKRDFFSWIRSKRPNVLEWNMAQDIAAKLHKKHPTLNPEALQHVIALSLKADLDTKVIGKNLKKIGVTLAEDEFNKIFLATLNTLEFNNYAKYLEQTAVNYSPAVVEFGVKLLHAAIFYGQQKELIQVAKPEVKLTTRNKKTVIICTFKGSLGVRKDALFELIPLRQPFTIVMQWTPKSGWIFHLPDNSECQELYERLGIMAMVRFSSVHKKELVAGLLGLSLGGLGWLLHQDIGSTTMLTLWILGGLAITVSGISSCIKHRGALLE